MSTRTFQLKARVGPAARVAGALLAMGLVLAACGTSSGGNADNAKASVYFAEQPGANPNYIFPYIGCAYFSVNNINQFQFMMYRPVYWFGLGSSVAVQYPLSMANQPTFSNSNKKVTFTMKGWKFSDGTTANAQSVMFFLNMYKADPSSYCGYNAGYGIPDQLASATGSGNTVTLTFKSSVSPNWLLYNYLSELTPMPAAWDITKAGAAAGSGHCSTGAFGTSATNTACKAVEKFLDAQALQTGSYTGSMWQTVDGPWKLTSFDTLGNATFVPNTKYSGPQKAQVGHFYMKSYTTAAAEQSDLYGGKLTVGYVDPSVLPGPAPSLGATGPNVAILSGKYKLMTGTPWSFNYAPVNFAASDPKASIIKQLYVRQALQEGINQLGIIKQVNKNYGVQSCSPIPPNTPTTISGNVACPYPFNLTTAKALLTSHGWHIVNGVQTCQKPGTASTECGAGIPAGTTLNLAMIWASGTPTIDSTMNAQIAAWRSIGINFSHSEGSFNNVTAQCDGGSFQVCFWGAGWIYAPDYYPSGETLFTPTGGFNPGKYSDPQMTNIINASVSQNVPLTQYGTYAATQLPVLYEPNPTSTDEYSTKLQGVAALNPLQNLMPEYWHF